MSQSKTKNQRAKSLLTGPGDQASRLARIGSTMASDAEADQQTGKKRPGRPPGKRSNPDYQSVTTFLHKQTYLDVQKALIGSDQDFGELVSELLRAWLARRG